MGLSASIPFLIQQKIKLLAAEGAGGSAARSLLIGPATAASAAVAASTSHAANAARLSYKANAIFSLCSWPFSLKLLWAPVVDAVFIRRLGRRKSWLVPVQLIAGVSMICGCDFVETQLGLGSSSDGMLASAFDVRGVTAFFFLLFFLMATQDIAVDGWALTMLSKRNRGRGPVCNSIGQNIGYFLSFVGFLALNDAESCNSLWRPLLGLKQDATKGLVSLGGFIRFMGYCMLVVTTLVALFKREAASVPKAYDHLPKTAEAMLSFDSGENDDELDASQLGLKETYHRLWEVCKLPSVRWLFLILLTYRLPTALSDNVKFLKAVEFGLSKSTTALLSPTLILPLGIMVPIIANKIWHDRPLRQFMLAYRYRVSLVPLLDIFLLTMLQHRQTSTHGLMLFWSVLILSTAAQAVVSSLQFNAQMTFFAHRVDPAIGGSYMTLLNTAANLGGVWPSSIIMWMIGRLSQDAVCRVDEASGQEICTTSGRDPYYILQLVASVLGLLWIFVFRKAVQQLENLPDESWRTHILDDYQAVDSPGKVVTADYDPEALRSVNVELGPKVYGAAAPSSSWIPRSHTTKEL
jgi:PAT family acetyl-CoA transporter-like MFS transporter 1